MIKISKFSCFTAQKLQKWKTALSPEPQSTTFQNGDDLGMLFLGIYSRTVNSYCHEERKAGYCSSWPYTLSSVTCCWFYAGWKSFRIRKTSTQISEDTWEDRQYASNSAVSEAVSVNLKIQWRTQEFQKHGLFEENYVEVAKLTQRETTSGTTDGAAQVLQNSVCHWSPRVLDK